MNHFLFAKENRYRTVVLVIIVLLVVSIIFLDSIQTLVLFPLYVFSLFFYYYRKTGEFNTLFLVYLVFSMLGEIGFVLDFSQYMNYVFFSTMIAQMSIIIMLKPMFKKIRTKDFSKHNLAEFVIGFIGINYIIGYVFYSIFPLIPDLTLFVPAIFSFIVLAGICIAIPFFNKHPKSILLWGVGGGLIAEVCSAFIYEYLSGAHIFLVMAYIFGLFLKFTLALFLMKLDGIVNSDADGDYL